MAVGVLEYAVVLVLGLVAGLLVRFLLAVVVGLVAVLVGIWFLGYVNAALAAAFVAGAWRFLEQLPIGAETLFTLLGLVFVLGLFGGLLLTTRLPALDRAAAA